MPTEDAADQTFRVAMRFLDDQTERTKETLETPPDPHEALAYRLVML